MVETITYQQNTREKLFIDLYKKAFPPVARYVSNLGGTMEDSKDVFQDALIIYYEKRNELSLQKDHNEIAYIVGTAKNLWHKKFKEKSKKRSLDTISNDTIQDKETTELSTNKLLTFLEAAGKKCMEILSAFYYDKRNAEEIADQFGYSSIRSATVQKFKCLEKVRDTVKSKSMNYEDFTE